MGEREEPPDILGEVLGADDAGGGSAQTAEADDDTEKEQGREETADSTGREGGPDRSSRSDDVKKRKATYYLREDTLSELEEVWFQLRQLADEGEKRSVSKSAIVEAALAEAIDDLNSKEEGSAIVQRLLG